MILGKAFPLFYKNKERERERERERENGIRLLKGIKGVLDFYSHDTQENPINS